MIQKSYVVNNDARIFVTPVLGYDAKTKSHVLAPKVEERVFQNKKELIRYLASETYPRFISPSWRSDDRVFNHRFDDPSYWGNNLILRQFSVGRAARTWNVGWMATENWDYWFHDSDGQTIDVRIFWSEVIAACRREFKRRRRKMKSHRCCLVPYGWPRRPVSGRARLGAYLRGFFGGRIGLSLFWSFFDDEDNHTYQWKPRDKHRVTIKWIGDIDYFDFRSSRSLGWKAHKCRRQWGHRVLEQEKHRKNRERKAIRRGTYLTEVEGDSE